MQASRILSPLTVVKDGGDAMRRSEAEAEELISERAGDDRSSAAGHSHHELCTTGVPGPRKAGFR